MSRNRTAELYEYYRQYLDKIAEYPLGITPKVSEINLSRGAIDRGYAEMKLFDFTGGLVEFVILVSSLYLLGTIVRRLKKFDWPVHGDNIRAVLKDFVESDPVGAAILLRSAPLVRVIDITQVDIESFEDDQGVEKRTLIWRLVNRLWHNRSLLMRLEKGIRDEGEVEDIVEMLDRHGFKPLITTCLHKQ